MSKMQIQDYKKVAENAQTELVRLRELMEDMHAFIMWAESKPAFDGGARLIVETLSHDLAGILNYERCWEPRSKGYAAKMKGKK